MQFLNDGAAVVGENADRINSDDPPRHLAAVDCGTNSFHLVIARVTAENRFEIVDREKSTVRLGSGSGDMKRLTDDAIDRAVSALTHFRKLAEVHDAPLRAVATSAVREADNRDVLMRRVREEAGIDLEVISGVEEARLIHLGALQAVPVFGRRTLFVDIGGGSTELIIGVAGEVLGARSLKLGAIRLTDRFFDRTKLRPGDVASCRTFVRSSLVAFDREVATHGYATAVGSSGTVHAVAAVAHAANGGGELRTFNNHRIAGPDVHTVVELLASEPTASARRRIPGVDADRADILLAGAIILEQIVERFGVDELIVSEYALREGVLLDTLQRRTGGSLHHLRDVSRRSVESFAQTFDEEPQHSAHAAALAGRLFAETTLLHGLSPENGEYLEAAALLANVGLFISHSRHHLHSYYLIRNSERLVGFNDLEIEIIAQVARYHRKSAPKPSHAEFAGLDAESQRLVRVLAGILRIAIALDRGHRQAVAAVRCTGRAEALVIQAVPATPGDSLDLELYTADQRSGLLAEVLGRPIVVERAEPSA